MANMAKVGKKLKEVGTESQEQDQETVKDEPEENDGKFVVNLKIFK